MTAGLHEPGLPEPTGRHRIGRTSFDVLDPTRREMFSSTPDAPRELVLWVWYPATPAPDAAPAQYLPEPWLPTTEFLGLDTAGVHSHAVADAPVDDAEPTYPALLLSPSGFPPLLLAAIAEEIASHGYVVVGVNHTFETAVTVFGDGRVVPMNPAAIAGVLGPQSGPYEERFRERAAVCRYKAADLASVADGLERLEADPASLLGGRVDVDRVGAFGHSFGGNAALQWCRDDGRCRAAANLDGALWTDVAQTGLDRPALQILAEHPEFAMTGAEAVMAGMAVDAASYEAEKSITFEGWRAVQQRARTGYTVQVKGASHLSFMDVPLLPLSGDSPARSMLAATKIEPARMWRITCDVLLAFFATHLNNAPVPPLLTGPSDYPELTYGAP